MELNKAKDLVRQLAGTSIVDKHDPEIGEAIRMVCEMAHRDEECKVVQNCIPTDMVYMGLYPHIMKEFKETTERITKKYTDVKTIPFNELEYQAEQNECAHMYLDDLGIPRKDLLGEVYSTVGRIKYLEQNGF